MTENNENIASAWIDPDDAPELGDDFFEHADSYVGDKLIRRGRPRGVSKTSATIRYDTDILEAFRATGKGWHTRMNNALRAYITLHPPA
jgi:uncharacterized protein (DUF4415 family)